MLMYLEIPSFTGKLRPWVPPPLDPIQKSSSPCQAPLHQYFLHHPCKTTKSIMPVLIVPWAPDLSKNENMSLYSCNFSGSKVSATCFCWSKSQFTSIFSPPILLVVLCSPSCQWSLCQAPLSLQNPTSCGCQIEVKNPQKLLNIGTRCHRLWLLAPV